MAGLHEAGILEKQNLWEEGGETRAGLLFLTDRKKKCRLGKEATVLLEAGRWGCSSPVAEASHTTADLHCLL